MNSLMTFLKDYEPIAAFVNLAILVVILCRSMKSE